MSLVGHWKLDGNARDNIGGNHGTEVGSVVYSAGKLNDCYDNTAGANTGIQLMPHAVADKYTYGNSWSLWFMSTTGSETNSTQRILSRDFSEYGPRISVDQNVNPNTLNFVSANINVGQWYHIVAASDNGINYDWYLDGDFIGSSTEPRSSTSRPYVIGGNTEGDGDITGNHFNGYIDDVRLYNHKLSVKEVKDLAKGKILHYAFEENRDTDGEIVVDSSGQDNHATLNTNTPSWNDIDPRIGSGYYSFLASNTEEIVTSSPAYPLSWGDEVTISLWTVVSSNAPTTTTYLSNIMGRGAFGGSHGIYRNPSNNDVGAYFRHDGGAANTSGAINFDEWVHLCATWDGSTLTFYINGVSVDSATTTASGVPDNEDWVIGGRKAYAGSNGDYFEGFIDDPRIYTRTLTADEVKELYQQSASLDDIGNLHSRSLQQNSSSAHGESLWYCFEDTSITYSAIHSGTEIIEMNGGTETVVVSKTSGPTRGTFSAVEGRVYYGTKPVHLFGEGANHAIVPYSLAGRIFGNYSVRYSSSIYNIFNPSSYDVTINVYDAVANGIDGTASTTINVSAGQSSGYITPTEDDWVFFEADTDIIMSVDESDGGDRMIMAPAAHYFYRRYNQYQTTVINTTPSTVATHGVHDPNNKCIAVGIADGGGGDADSGLPLENLACNYSWGNTLSDYQLVTPYNCTIDVSYWDGSAWQLGESHTMSGTLLSPDGQFRDGSVGFGSEGTDNSGSAANLGAGATLWKFEGSKPFLVVINDTTNDEEILLGWNTTEKVFSPQKTHTEFLDVSEVGPMNGIVSWYPFKNDIDDDAGTNDADLSTDMSNAERGFAFNGSTSEIIKFNNSSLQIVGDLTISFWLYIDTIVERTTILDKAYGGEFTINLETAGDLRFYRGLGGGNTTPYSNIDSPAIPLDTWTFCCVRVEEETATWNINGSDTGSSTDSNFVGSASTRDLTIGTGYTGGHLDGFMEDLRFYKQALTLEEINILYEMTNPNLNQRMKFDRSSVYVKNQINEG